MYRRWGLPALLATLFFITACAPSTIEGSSVPPFLDVASGSLTQTTMDGQILKNVCTYDVGDFPPGEDPMFAAIYLFDKEGIYTMGEEEVVNGKVYFEIPVDDANICTEFTIYGLKVVTISGMVQYACHPPTKGTNISRCDLDVDRDLNAGEGSKRRV